MLSFVSSVLSPPLVFSITRPRGKILKKKGGGGGGGGGR
eukprot:COSAG06_NODE_58875_length_276_cov_0.355932_1_plen_38_part_10